MLVTGFRSPLSLSWNVSPCKLFAISFELVRNPDSLRIAPPSRHLLAKLALLLSRTGRHELSDFLHFTMRGCVGDVRAQNTYRVAFGACTSSRRVAHVAHTL